METYTITIETDAENLDLVLMAAADTAYTFGSSMEPTPARIVAKVEGVGNDGILAEYNLPVEDEE